MSGPIATTFFAGDALEVAPLLLNKLLVRGSRALRIVEVEAYRGGEDPASHAFRGRTPRNATMFGPPGRLYVYFTYGMHWCSNVVCAPEGTAQAVLLRAGAPVNGTDEMSMARGLVARSGSRPWAPHELAGGPARLCQALAITGSDNGADLVSGDRGLLLLDDGVAPPEDPARSGRVGIREATDLLWRWWVPGDLHVSKGRASGSSPSISRKQLSSARTARGGRDEGGPGIRV